MNKEFIQYTEALELKELGFDEPCFGRYYYKESYPMLNPQSEETELVFEFGQYIKQTKVTILAPLYQQAFRWFREKYGLHKHICYFNDTNVWHGDLYKLANGGLMNAPMELTGYKTYEEAELACLRKLIEIVKEKL